MPHGAQGLNNRSEAETRGSYVAGVTHEDIRLDACQYGRKTGLVSMTYSFEITMNYAAGVEKVKAFSDIRWPVEGVRVGSNTSVGVLTRPGESAPGCSLMQSVKPPPDIHFEIS